jgi:ABC-type branched-subunit amino acid transport system substrate-binding protein
MRSSSRQRAHKLGVVPLAFPAVALTCALVAVPSGVAAAHAATNRAHATKGKSPITEAIVIAYTGPVSFEGGAADSGVYPAVQEINKDGGVLGHKMKIQPEDDRGDPADAVPLVDKLLATASNLVGVDGPGTAEAPTVVPILNSAHVVDMNIGGNAVFDHSHYKYMWRLVPPDPANGEAMALWAKAKGYKKVAAVFGTTTGSEGDRPGVVSGLKKIGASLVASETLTPQQPSYRAEVEQVIAAHPQAIMTESDGTTAATFFSELKQLGGLVPIIGTTATDISTWLNPVRSAIGAATFKKYYTSVIDGTPKTTAATAAYKSALEAVKSKVPSPWTQWVTNPYSGAQYDGIITQALAMTAAKTTTPKKYNNDIMAVTEPGAGKTKVYTYAQGVRALKKGKKIQYVGATGLIRFDKYHNSFGTEAAVTVDTQDNPRVVKTITEQQIQTLG